MMSKFLQLVNKIISWNCLKLAVPLPSVRVVEASEFATSTVKCAVSSDGHELLINRIFAESNPDVLFCWLVLSHECRHIWQTSHKTNLFNNYKQSSGLSVQEYNEQAAEVDAWAWSVVVVSEKFKIRPTLEKNFGVKLWEQIKARSQQIVEKKIF